ncbi:MAG: hypothetical protein R3338_12010 [Thermoanaerobaculia bacterium]|nr:hypothetical protein [Thermoanaerobaculia bacterium]
MKKGLTGIVLMIALISAAACGSIFDDDDDRPDLMRDRCWVEIFEEAGLDRDGAWTRLEGPCEFSNLSDVAGRDWNDSISSLELGPGAVVLIFEHADFEGEIRELESAFVENLEDEGMNDRVSSLRIRCR